jgi:hypothetical protein
VYSSWAAATLAATSGRRCIPAADERRCIPATNGPRRRTVGGVYASACVGRLAGRARASGAYAGERWTPGRLIWWPISDGWGSGLFPRWIARWFSRARSVAGLYIGGQRGTKRARSADRSWAGIVGVVASWFSVKFPRRGLCPPSDNPS